jgi:hypothetical protein
LDADSIAQAAIPVLSDAQRAARLGQAARARVQSVFLQEHFMDRFRQALSPLMEQASRHSLQGRKKH